MTLTLTVLRCPDAVVPETRQVGGGEFSIGRGPDNNWMLPDPDRHLSKRHCVLVFRAGGWQLADTSTNGTFLNRDADPVGPGSVRDLRDGDRLRLGAYEIEIRITEETAQPSAFGGFGGGFAPAPNPPAAAPFRADPFGADPFAPPPPPPAADVFSAGAFGSGLGTPQVALPADYDPLGGGFDAPLGAPTQPDHTPAFSDAFQPPRPAGGGIPDDWNLDLGAPAMPAHAPPPPAADPFAAPFAPPIAPPAAPPPPPATSFAAPGPSPIPEGFAASPFGESPAPAAAQPPPPQSLAPLAPATASPFDEAPAPFAPIAPLPVAPMPVAPMPAVPMTAPTPQSAAAPAATAGDGTLLAAFLRGADMAGTDVGDPVAKMEALGAAFRALVGGLRQVLIARAAIKGEFRIEQTMIRARGNNPLKFSTGDDDALTALIGAGRRSDMAPGAAVADALRDIRLHELASVAAMQTAVRALLARLDPAPLRNAAEGGGIALPGARKARAWDEFEKLHAAITQALSDDFDSVFGKSFARAYEQALAEASAKESQP